jgi:hypothetical protein
MNQRGKDIAPMTLRDDPENNGNDVPAPQLRDLVYMWLYATVTILGEIIQNGAPATSAPFWPGLRGRVADTSANQEIFESVYQAILQNRGDFLDVSGSFVALPSIVGIEWPAQHPSLDELDSIFESFD